MLRVQRPEFGPQVQAHALFTEAGSTKTDFRSKQEPSLRIEPHACDGPAAWPPVSGLLEGQGGLWGQYRSSYRAVAGDCESGWGGGYWRLEVRLGAAPGYGSAFGAARVTGTRATRRAGQRTDGDGRRHRTDRRPRADRPLRRGRSAGPSVSRCCGWCPWSRGASQWTCHQ